MGGVRRVTFVASTLHGWGHSGRPSVARPDRPVRALDCLVTRTPMAG